MSYIETRNEVSVCVIVCVMEMVESMDIDGNVGIIMKQ